MIITRSEIFHLNVWENNLNRKPRNQDWAWKLAPPHNSAREMQIYLSYFIIQPQKATLHCQWLESKSAKCTVTTTSPTSIIVLLMIWFTSPKTSVPNNGVLHIYTGWINRILHLCKCKTGFFQPEGQWWIEGTKCSKKSYTCMGVKTRFVQPKEQHLHRRCWAHRGIDSPRCLEIFSTSCMKN